MSIKGRPTWAIIYTIGFSVLGFVGCEVDVDAEGGSARQALLENCKTAQDCEDGDPCTNNVCTLGQCLPPVLVIGCDPGEGGAPSGSGGVLNTAGVLNGAGTSSGGALNTGGTGLGFGGTVTQVACSEDRDCSDGDSCSTNLCVLDVCVVLPVVDCVLGAGGEPSLDLSCSKDAECEEGHPCTDNKCVAGACVTLPVLDCCFDGHCVIGVGGTTQVEIGGKNGGGSSAGGTSAGGSSAGGTPGNEAGSPAENEGGAGSSSGGTKGGPDSDEWAMQGGSCAVKAPVGGGWGSLLVLAGLGAVWMRRRRQLAAALAAAPLALAATRAHAEGFAQDTFTAPAAPDDLMWTERAGSDAGDLRPFGRLTLGYADDPLVLVDANDSSNQVRVVDNQFALYGAFGFGFFHRAHLAVLMPLYVQSSSFEEAAGNIKGTKPGDLGFDGRFTILDRHAPLELALAATLRVPTGDRESYASDGKVTVWPRALLSKQLSDAGTLINLSAGPVIRPKNQEVGVTTGTQFRFTAGVLLALTKVIGVTGEVAGSATTTSSSKRNTPLEGALGGRLNFGSFVLGSTIGTGLTEGVGSPDWRWLAMIAVPGPFEQEPEKEPATPIAAEDDPDHDGVRGAADKCPNEAGKPERDGCPDGDDDHDGILNSKDKCPQEAEDKDGFEDEDGCPDLDNDKDGVPDVQDKCPTEAEDLDKWMDEDGCPDADNDADGVPDADDKCPNEPETKNGIDDADGCPDLLRVESGQIRTLEPIYFDYNKATIQARSEPLLLEMANLIRTRPDLGAIVIEGHTDNKGAAKYNLKLSRDRAASVRTFLVTAGVPEARLSSDGFGSERPIADNKTDAGRAQNRRVEFHFAAPAAAPPPVATPPAKP